MGGLSEAGIPEDHSVCGNLHPKRPLYQGEMKAHGENSRKSHSNGGHFNSLNDLSQKTKLVKNMEPSRWKLGGLDDVDRNGKRIRGCLLLKLEECHPSKFILGGSPRG